MISICIKILHLFGRRLYIGVSLDGGLPDIVRKYMGWGHFWAFKPPKKLAHIWPEIWVFDIFVWIWYFVQIVMNSRKRDQ